MKIESFSCDRCGHVQDRDRKFTDADRWMRTITLVMQDGHVNNHGSIRLNDRDVTKVANLLWCDQCCAEMGLSDTRVSPAKPDEPARPTMEDVIREIVREEIQNGAQS